MHHAHHQPVKGVSSLEEAGSVTRQIAEHLQKAEELRLARDEKITALNEEAATQIEAQYAVARSLAKAVLRFATRNRISLTNNESVKTVALTLGGLFRWLKPPHSLAIEDEERTLALLKHEGFTDCIRVEEKIDKEKLKRMLIEHPNRRKRLGVSLVSVEKFIISPADTQLRLEKELLPKASFQIVTPKSQK